MQPGAQTFSSPHRPMGWFGLGLMAVMLVLTFYDGFGIGRAAFASAVLLFAAVIAVVYIRPGLQLREDHLLVRNALSDVAIPWRAIKGVGVRHVMEIDVEGRVVRALAFGRTMRQQRRHSSGNRSEDAVDYTDFVVDQVRDTAERHARQPATAASADVAPVGTWRWPEIGALAALAALTVVLAVLA